MARRSYRQAHVQRLLKSFLQFHREKIKRSQRRKLLREKFFQRAGLFVNNEGANQIPHRPDSLASITSGDSESENMNSLEVTDSDFDMESLGSSSRSQSVSSTDSEASLSSIVSEISLADLPDPLSTTHGDSDDTFNLEDGDDNNSDLEGFADDEDSDDEETPIRLTKPMVSRGSILTRSIRESISDMYSHRYQMPRNTLPRGPAYLPHVLQIYKQLRPDKFREVLRVWPTTFDRLVKKIEDDTIFTNNSNNAQLSVEEQLAITLFRFGHSGNGASIQNIANWAGVGKGTVLLVTRRVMTAILRQEFMKDAVHYPSPEEKEKAKQWVEAHSCKAWRNGWYLDSIVRPPSLVWRKLL